MNLKNIKKITPSFIERPLKKIYFYILFIIDFKKFKKKSKNDIRFPVLWENRYPRLSDNTANTNFDHHYIYHPAWAARIVKKINPEFHVDISSTLSFSSILSAFIPVRFYDYRPANLSLSNLKSDKADLMKLPFADDSIGSLSCMHTIEHIGLGRYGDALDPDGDIRAIKELKRVTTKGGSLLFVVPVGKPRIMFNAHRIYSYDQIISHFKDFELKEFALIPDDAQKDGIIINATKEQTDKQNYGCGCFWFIK